MDDHSEALHGFLSNWGLGIALVKCSRIWVTAERTRNTESESKQRNPPSKLPEVQWGHLWSQRLEEAYVILGPRGPYLGGRYTPQPTQIVVNKHR